AILAGRRAAACRRPGAGRCRKASVSQSAYRFPHKQKSSKFEGGDMSAQIESVLSEGRLFPPPEAFVRQAAIAGMDQYEALCAEAEKDHAGFWARLAREHLVWRKPFTRALDDTQAPFFK